MRKLKEISEQIREQIIQSVEAADSPESALDKTLIDMKQQIATAKELTAAAIAEKQRLKRACQETVDAAQAWAQKAEAALQNRDIAAARAARQNRQRQTQRAADYERQIRAQHAVITSLKTVLNEFYQQFQKTVERAETLHHGQKQAEMRVELHKLLAEIEPSLSNAFKRAEQKLKKTEAEAKFWEKQSHRTETDGDGFTLDQELAKLKEDILGRKQND